MAKNTINCKDCLYALSLPDEFFKADRYYCLNYPYTDITDKSLILDNCIIIRMTKCGADAKDFKPRDCNGKTTEPDHS